MGEGRCLVPDAVPGEPAVFLRTGGDPEPAGRIQESLNSAEKHASPETGNRPLSPFVSFCLKNTEIVQKTERPDLYGQIG